MQLFKTEKSSLPSNLLKDKYIVPPFSILNTISSNWQQRKDKWEQLGLNSADGRDIGRHNAVPVNTFSARGKNAKTPESISTFDPLLCEIVYKWFSKEGYSVIDPFAGGSVRGIVAGCLNRNYIGVDLSEDQIIANWEQLNGIQSKYSNIEGDIDWIIADSFNLTTAVRRVTDKEFDLLFTCPPYYNLEVYSKDPNDLSNLKTYDEFIARLGYILGQGIDLLKENSFAVIVVSEIRSKSGEYYGFVPDVINIFRNKGVKYYNEIILENNIGSLPIRAPKYFDQSRKIGKHHQNILVFYKGELSEIEEKYGKFF
jgi:DNA modification methylase